MLTLVIDTATPACSVALFEGARVVAARHEVIGRGHAERLLPVIAELPDKGRADRIMVDVGPGSFTGIRVGVAAARALGLAWRVPVHGYGCLALVAAMARAAEAEGAAVDVIMNGGHGEYFFERFDTGGKSVSPAVSLSSNIIEQHSNAPFIAGDAAVRLTGRTHIEIMPDASKWYLISLTPPLPASPIYGRAPDARMPAGSAQ